MSKGFVKRQLSKGSVHKKMSKGSVKKQMSEGSVHKQISKGSVNKQISKGSVKKQMSEIETFRRQPSKNRSKDGDTRKLPEIVKCGQCKIWGRYHGGRRPSSDDSFHSPTVIPPSVLDKPIIMKRNHRRRTTR